MTSGSVLGRLGGRALAAAIVLFGGAANATHPTELTNLRQQENCQTPPCNTIQPGAFVAGTSLRVTASSDMGTCGGSNDLYAMEIEVRPFNQSYTGVATHTSTTMTKISCVLQDYPWTVITGLSPGQYKWRVREKVAPSFGTPSTGQWTEFGTGTDGGNPASPAFILGNPSYPELIPEVVNLANMVSTPTALSFDVSPTLRNYGTVAANNFHWRAFLSTDRNKDASDVQVFATSAPMSIVAATTGAPATATPVGRVNVSPKPAAGQYYVIVEVDHTNAVNECTTAPCTGQVGETNNVAATTNFFTSGVDLVATSVAGPTNSGPGNVIQIPVSWFNQGSDAAGNVEYRVLLSTDTVSGPGDFTLHSGTKAISGGMTVNETLSVTVPMTVPGGEFHYLLVVDSAATVAEAKENNNQVASTAKVTMQQSDLVLETVDFVDVLTGAPTTVGFLGQTAKLRIKMSNAGGANANNFNIAVVLSKDTNLTLLSDHMVHEEQVAVLPAGQTVTKTITLTLPLNDRANKPYPSAPYYFYVMLDSKGAVGELNEGNNILANGGQTVQAVTLKAPAQDYTATQLDAPAVAAVGELAPVFRVLRNVGNQDGAKVTYRYFASVNEIITRDDVPLVILGPNNTTNEAGEVTLTKASEDRATELVKFPPAMPPATYYVGIIIDAENAAPELDEDNNAVPSTSTVQVAAGSMRITTSQLPDAMVDRPYQVRLSVVGDNGQATWAVDARDGSLPAGMTLAQDGTLSGTPTAATVGVFTVVATAGARQAAARLVLRVLPSTSQLTITSTNLPPVVNSPGLAYQASLGAAGGVKPYGWKVISGALPAGITLGNEGVFNGAVRPGVALGESRVTFQVQDALGSRATAELRVRVVEPGALIISNERLQDSMVGSDYAQDLAAVNADQRPLATPLSWTVAAGSLPPGLTLRAFSEERGILEGKPSVAGTYAFSIQVEDAKGRADVSDFVVRVFAGRVKVVAVSPPPVLHPGDEVSFAVTAPGVGMTYSRYAGELPPGLSLSEEGNITGTITDDPASVGIYNFVVEAKDAAGTSGLGAFTLEVIASPRAGGCQTASGNGGWMAGAALALAALLRRRRLS